MAQMEDSTMPENTGKRMTIKEYVYAGVIFVWVVAMIWFSLAAAY